jgi:hypothetical protein
MRRMVSRCVGSFPPGGESLGWEEDHRGCITGNPSQTSSPSIGISVSPLQLTEVLGEAFLSRIFEFSSDLFWGDEG